MKLNEKYQEELKSIQNPAINALLQTVDVCEWGVDRPENFDSKRTIYVGQSTPIDQAVALLHKTSGEHFVQVDKEGFIFDLLSSTIMLQKPAAFIKNPLAFFMNNFKPDQNNPEAVRSTTFTFHSSTEKSSALESINQFVEKNQKTANFMEAVHMIADELMMNALYNAPATTDGRPLFMDKDRAQRVDLPDGKKARLFITHDQRRLLIGCEDPFGSFNRFRLMKQLGKVYKDRNNAEPNSGSGGAGLGCKMMIDNSCGFYVVTKKGVRTLVCCALPLGVSYLKAEKMPKDMHLVFF